MPAEREIHPMKYVNGWLRIYEAPKSPEGELKEKATASYFVI